MVDITEGFALAALNLADKEQSKISERERELFGFSSSRLKALLNNLCSPDNTRYLEIGVYKGSTLLSALYGNKTCKAVAVENYKYDAREPKKWADEGQIWENMKSQLAANISRYAYDTSPVNTENLTLLEADFDKAPLEQYGPYDVCFFDVAPVTQETYSKFFESVLPQLNSKSIVVFSQFSNETSSDDLEKALRDNSDKVTVDWRQQRISSGISDSTKYYSGILVVGLTKVEKTISIPKKVTNAK